MSLPHLLLVDDSDAVLSYEKAALSAHYLLSTASDGEEALLKIQELEPDGVLLDLSMPKLGGDEVLRRVKQIPTLQDIPILIVSSEGKRAEACLELGAAAFLRKPIKAEELRTAVGRVLDEALRRRSRGLFVLFVCVGGREFGLPLSSVRQVVQQPRPRDLLIGPAYLSSMFELHGQPVAILDLALRLGLPYEEPIVDRKLVIVAHEKVLLALCVDRVNDPVEFHPKELVSGRDLGGGEHGQLAEALIAMARTPRGILPVVAPFALISRQLLKKLPDVLRHSLEDS